MSWSKVIFATFGKEICQSGFEGGSFDHQRDRIAVRTLITERPSHGTVSKVGVRCHNPGNSGAVDVRRNLGYRSRNRASCPPSSTCRQEPLKTVGYPIPRKADLA
jgi:hypothetical protein